MGGWDDDTAVQRKAQLRLLSSLPALRLQNSAERADASGITHHPVPEVRRSIRRDEWPETHQHLLSAALPAAAYTGVPCQASRHCPGKPRVSSRRWIVFLSPNCPMDLNGLMKSNSMAIDLRWCERAVCQGLTAEKMKECVWVRPEVVAEIQFLEWTGAEAAGSDYTCSSNTAREVPGHAFLSPAVWQRV